MAAEFTSCASPSLFSPSVSASSLSEAAAAAAAAAATAATAAAAATVATVAIAAAAAPVRGLFQSADKFQQVLMLGVLVGYFAVFSWAGFGGRNFTPSCLTRACSSGSSATCSIIPAAAMAAVSYAASPLRQQYHLQHDPCGK